MLKKASVGLAIAATAGALLASSPAPAQAIPASARANVAYVQTTTGVSAASVWGGHRLRHCLRHHPFHRFRCFHRFRHFHRFDGFNEDRNFNFNENRNFNFNENRNFNQTSISNINTNIAR
ncbi:MAG: hypothetical protein J2P17_34945 [Mycobacterium sp.]|nr:hypothetical protein [Mycobacterium sp.]